MMALMAQKKRRRRIPREDWQVICKRYTTQNETLQQIANDYGVSRERVRQILDFSGITYDDSHRKTVLLEKKTARKEAYLNRFLPNYGCTRREYLEITEGKHWRESCVLRYREHRRNTKCRGIEWKFTLPEWVKVWKDSGHWNERGRSGYVMGRFNDAGPYAPDNVHIVTASVNVREAIDRFRKQGRQWGRATGKKAGVHKRAA